MPYVKLGCSKPAGYCWYHRSTMSVRQIKTKQCLKRHCSALQRLEQHPWWDERAKRNELRKAGKAGKKN